MIRQNWFVHKNSAPRTHICVYALTVERIVTSLFFNYFFVWVFFSKNLQLERIKQDEIKASTHH